MTGSAGLYWGFWDFGVQKFWISVKVFQPMEPWLVSAPRHASQAPGETYVRPIPRYPRVDPPLEKIDNIGAEYQKLRLTTLSLSRVEYGYSSQNILLVWNSQPVSHRVYTRKSIDAQRREHWTYRTIKKTLNSETNSIYTEWDNSGI